jgi:hypothetical protein
LREGRGIQSPRTSGTRDHSAGREANSSGKEVVDKPPVYRDVALPTAPHTEITAKGDIVYTEVSRQNVRKLESYVKGKFSSGLEIEIALTFQRWLLVVPLSTASTSTKSSLILVCLPL